MHVGSVCNLFTSHHQATNQTDDSIILMKLFETGTIFRNDFVDENETRFKLTKNEYILCLSFECETQTCMYCMHVNCIVCFALFANEYWIINTQHILYIYTYIYPKMFSAYKIISNQALHVGFTINVLWHSSSLTFNSSPPVPHISVDESGQH